MEKGTINKEQGDQLRGSFDRSMEMDSDGSMKNWEDLRYSMETQIAMSIADNKRANGDFEKTFSTVKFAGQETIRRLKGRTNTEHVSGKV